MLLLGCVLLGIVVGLLRRGSLRYLAELHIRWVWLIFLGFFLQTAAFTGIGPILLAKIDFGTAVSHDQVFAYGGPALHLASYAVILLLVVLNLNFRSLRLFALGTLANVAAIAANGGYMPASPAALQAAGMEEELRLLVEKGHVANSTLASGATRLAFLGDVLPLPLGPLANVFSVGDVLIGLGALLLVAAGMRPRPQADAGDYAAALAFIQAWPVPPAGSRPSGPRIRRTTAA